MNALARHFRENSQPLEPVPTEALPRLERLDGIRAVVFDIYGTLIISAAGDISLAEEAGHDGAIRGAIQRAGLELSPGARDLATTFHQLIRRQQDLQREMSDNPFPEVEIREIWGHLLDWLAEESVVEGDFNDPATIERIAVAYECAVNPVWPMPGLAELLAELRARELPQGIVSNAQFYTPLMFPAFLDADLTSLGFPEPLQIYSYQHRIGKPSRRLYEISAERLRERGIEPGEALYVGNDRLKDVWPAQAVGFRTALFAGDGRSLRWREEDERVAGVEPDLVITDLGQIVECLG